jgi:hypothetical protein
MYYVEGRKEEVQLEVELLVLEGDLVEEVQSLLEVQLVASAAEVAHTGHLAAAGRVRLAVACKDWAQLASERVERQVQPKADFRVQEHIDSKERRWMWMEVAGMGTLHAGSEVVQGSVLSTLLLAVIES